NDVEGKRVLDIAEKLDFDFSYVNTLGKVSFCDTYMQEHIQQILDLPLVDTEAIKKANFKIALDAVNSTGGIFVPALLDALGVKTVHKIYCDANGHFPHNPEPLAEHLTDLSELVVAKQADLGIAVDPDVDRLCFVMEDGTMFGEEYTLVAVSDYVL